MANSDRTLSLLKIMTNDIKVSDSELASLMQLVLDEILVETRIIKKMYQLTIFDTLEFYDLKSNATLQDRYETGVSGVSLANPTASISDVILRNRSHHMSNAGARWARCSSEAVAKYGKMSEKHLNFPHLICGFYGALFSTGRKHREAEQG